MTHTTTPRPFDTGLAISGAVLVALGGLLGAIGMSLGITSLVGAARRWQRGTEMSTSELARHALLAARAGSTAGVQTWRRAGGPLVDGPVSNGTRVADPAAVTAHRP